MADRLTAEIVRELLDYDPATGVLTWKRRDRSWFPSDTTYKRWNTEYAGKRALGSVNPNGYLVGPVLGKTYKAARVAWLWMTGDWPEEQVDHINHDRIDDRWCNLRQVTHKQNGRNQKLGSNNSSGFHGVRKYPYDPTRYQARISVDGKDHHLGTFDRLKDAVEARQAAERRYEFQLEHGK